ncbi:MAG: HlyD family efflux transporter periplasmic adaptor subunit [Methyloceanibacter sp.]|jgi:membrane fusion protein|nr:HlyD family efflux transporter periplasmic adaptor subunit [Methyloceanibacter sp.]
MTRSLFRPEALEFQKQYREFGQVGRLQSSSAKALAWLLTIAVGSLIVFVCIAGYTRKETVGGYLAPALGTSNIFVPEQGTITAVHVAQEQRVAKGDILLTIDTSQITADGVDVNATILKSLSLQKTLLTNQVNEEERTTRAEHARLTAAITSGQAELAQLSAQMQIQQEQIDLAQKLVNTAEKMHAAGYMAAPELFSRREGLLQARQGLSALKQRHVARETELAETRSALEQMPTQSARRLQPLQSELAQIDQRSAEIGGRQSFSIRAPIDGRVANVQAKVGQIADPKKPQLDILPLESPLQAVLFVPTRAIGFVRPGQKVRLLYEAFPFQRFGTYSGHVVSVSKTILSETEVAAPVQLREAAYKVIAALDRPDVDANGQKIPLQAGMLLRADILLERRELVRWLLDPILNVRM